MDGQVMLRADSRIPRGVPALGSTGSSGPDTCLDSQSSSSGLAALCPYANFAQTRAPTNCWVVHNLPTLPSVLKRLGVFYINCNAVPRASSNFSSAEYRQRFLIWPSPPLGWASCSNFGIAAYSLLVDGFIFVRFN